MGKKLIVILAFILMVSTCFISCASSYDIGPQGYTSGNGSEISSIESSKVTLEHAGSEVVDNDINDGKTDNKETNNEETDKKETDGNGAEENLPIKVVVPAQIVNKNGAKGVFTLLSDDGDQRTSDFLHTVIAPKYDTFKLTVAIPTHKIADVGLINNGKEYNCENGKYSFSSYKKNEYVSSISGSVFKAGAYANMRDFWRKITESGVIELASHSHNHDLGGGTDEIVYKNGTVLWPKGSMTMEICASAQLLRNGLKQETPFIVRPGGTTLTAEMIRNFKDAVAKGNTYLGVQGSNGAPPFKGVTTANSAKLNTVKKFTELEGRLTIATLLVRSYEAGFNAAGDGFATTKDSSKASVKAAGISAWKQYVDYAMQYGQWASITFHSIVPDTDTAEGYEVYDWQVKALMDYVQPLAKKGDIWLASFADAAKYYFEWSSAELRAECYNNEYIEVKLTDKEADARFDEALTVKLSIPKSWTTAKLTTNGATTNLTIHTNADGSKFVYANIVPSDNISTVRP